VIPLAEAGEPPAPPADDPQPGVRPDARRTFPFRR
jgi:hypothetical protein